MNAQQIRKWLALLGETHLDADTEWVRTHCPLAPWTHERGTDRNPSFGVKVQPGESFCHCFSCRDASGSQTELLIKLRAHLGDSVHTVEFKQAMRMIVAEEDDDGVDLELDLEEDLDDQVFPESWLASFQPAYSGDQVHWYLEQRGVPARVAAELDLRYMHSQDRVCFPIRNWDGDLIGLHGRAVEDDVQPRYRVIRYRGQKNLLGWLGESWVKPWEPVVLAESVFDLARVYQVYRNVMCPLTASLSDRKVERIAVLDHVVTYFDSDKAGDFARARVERCLAKPTVVEHLRPIGQDPGDMTVAQVAEQLEGVVDLDEVIA